MSRRSSRSSIHLEPPRKSVELHDPGAKELQSSDGEDEYFSDASEGRRRNSRPATPTSPVPRTRIEKVDNSPRHGEVPGTPAYDMRRRDAVPDEVEVVPEPGRLSKRSSQFLEPPRSPGGSLIPRTVVEKVDPSSPSYGEDPDSAAYHKRLADAVPDVVLKAPEPGKRRRFHEDSGRARATSDASIPEIITPIDDTPERRRTLDASPEIFENPSDSGSTHFQKPVIEEELDDGIMQTNEYNKNDDNDFGDDFDDFEEGGQAVGDDDFGDFDNAFEATEAEAETEPVTPVATSQNSFIPSTSYPLIDIDTLSSFPDVLAATQLHLDAMFPNTTEEKITVLSDPEPISNESPIFPSERSKSLWKQLVTPPPLQPPNWTQSKIRRLFLVSLGVPVDLDEILPPSKQKKLILPDINLQVSRELESDKGAGATSDSKAQDTSDSRPSADGTQAGGSKSNRTKRIKGPPPPPELDLVVVKRLCATTDEKLDGMTDEELQTHVKQLESTTEKTSELLEYWLKRRDGLRKEKEAFEGVIENLVAHVRRVRR